jgi:hypothetical protein
MRREQLKGDNMKYVLLIIGLLATSVCSAQVIDKVGDKYTVAIMETDRAEQEAIIANADKEIAIAQEYCQREYIAPQEAAKAKARSIISAMDSMDVQKAELSGASVIIKDVNWSDIEPLK